MKGWNSIFFAWQALGRPQGDGGQPEPEAEPEPGKAGNVGNVLQKATTFNLFKAGWLFKLWKQAGSFFDKQKGSITSLLGLSNEEGGDPKALLTTILEVSPSS